MTWALGKTVDLSALVAYEAMMNEFYRRSPAVGLCLYSLTAFPPHILQLVLSTHPEAVYQGHLCVNRFYEPPEVALAADVPRARVEWMLGELRPALASKARNRGSRVAPVRRVALAR